MQKQFVRVQIKTGRSRIYNFTCVTAVARCCPLHGRLQSLKYKRDCKVSVVSNLCSQIDIKNADAKAERRIKRKKKELEKENKKTQSE